MGKFDPKCGMKEDPLGPNEEFVKDFPEDNGLN